MPRSDHPSDPPTWRSLTCRPPADGRQVRDCHAEAGHMLRCAWPPTFTHGPNQHPEPTDALTNTQRFKASCHTPGTFTRNSDQHLRPTHSTSPPAQTTMELRSSAASAMRSNSLATCCATSNGLKSTLGAHSPGALVYDNLARARDRPSPASQPTISRCESRSRGSGDDLTSELGQNKSGTAAPEGPLRER